MHHKYQLQCIIRHHSASQRIRRHHRALQDILQCITRHHSTPQRSTTQYKTPRVSKETSGVSIWRPATACSRCCLETIDLTYASDTRTGSNQRLFLQSRKPAPYKASRRMTGHYKVSQRITVHHNAPQRISRHHSASQIIIPYAKVPRKRVRNLTFPCKSTEEERTRIRTIICGLTDERTRPN